MSAISVAEDEGDALAVKVPDEKSQFGNRLAFQPDETQSFAQLYAMATNRD